MAATKLPALAGLTELDPSSMGEAMRALSTQRQRNFVAAKVYYGLNDHDACIAAGYSPAHANHHAYEVARHPQVQAAIEEEARKLLKSEGPRSILALVEIRDQKANKSADRIKAATELLNRAGLHAISEAHVHTHDHVSVEEADRRIAAFFAQQGVAADVIEKLLVHPEDMKLLPNGVYELAPTPEPAPLSDNPTAIARRETRARRRGMGLAEVEADKARVEAARVDTLRRERARHEAIRRGDTVTDVEDEPAAPAGEPEVW